MTESKPIPALAQSALALATAEFKRNIATLATQTLQAMGIVDEPGWVVHFDQGFATRDIPDAPPPPATLVQ